MSEISRSAKTTLWTKHLFLLLLANRFENLFDTWMRNNLDKFKIVNWNSFDLTCKNKRAIFTHSINFTGPSWCLRCFIKLLKLPPSSGVFCEKSKNLTPCHGFWGRKVYLDWWSKPVTPNSWVSPPRVQKPLLFLHTPWYCNVYLFRYQTLFSVPATLFPYCILPVQCKSLRIAHSFHRVNTMDSVIATNKEQITSQL